MKEDILEQIAEDYFNLQQSVLTKHNIKYRPRDSHEDYIASLDSVHSDIDVLAYNPRQRQEIFVVSCKSWQSGFSIAKFKKSIELAITKQLKKPKGKRPPWTHFRELCSSKWTDAFISEIREITGLAESKEIVLNYWILCTRITAAKDLREFEESQTIRRYFKKFKCRIVLKVKLIDEMLSEILSHLTTKDTPAVETTHFSRTIQLLIAAGYVLKKEHATAKNKHYTKREMKKLSRSMDFVTDNFLNNDALSWKKQKPYAEIYQQLGLAWEYLAERCKHWDGYEKRKDGTDACKICGRAE